MKLFILLVCLAIERYLHIGTIARRFFWLESYLLRIQKRYANHLNRLEGYRGVFITLVPILVIVGVPYLVATHQDKWPLLVLAIQFLVLIYCLGPNNLYHHMQVYLHSKEIGDTKTSDAEYMLLTGESAEPDDPKVAGRKITETIFINGNEYFLGVIFWYIFLGPLGCLVYRFVYMLARSASQGEEAAMVFAEAAIKLDSYLNWLPSRFSSLLFVLWRGHKATKTWKSYVFSKEVFDNECLVRCGLAGVNKDNLEDLPPLEENKKALALLDRALYLVLGVMLMGTFLSWILSTMGYSILLLTLL